MKSIKEWTAYKALLPTPMALYGWAWIWLGFVEIGFDGSTLEVQTLFLDRENVLWMGTIKQGIYRIHGRKGDHFHRAESLSSDPLYRFYEDREGNLWAATAEGFDWCSGIQ